MEPSKGQPNSVASPSHNTHAPASMNCCLSTERREGLPDSFGQTSCIFEKEDRDDDIIEQVKIIVWFSLFGLLMKD